MNGRSFLSGFLNIWVLLGAFLLAGAMIAVVLSGAWVMRANSPTGGAALTPQVTVIAAPTLTAVFKPTLLITATATVPAAAQGSGPIAVGVYVKITGTDGAGLNIREGAGIASPKKFLGMDEELFQVKDGPQKIDGLTWWFLQAPYDVNRAGWAAEKYLAVIQALPTPTGGSGQ